MQLRLFEIERDKVQTQARPQSTPTEQFVGNMRAKFPAVDKFVKEDYPLALEKGRLGR
jgi:hypothetical protein